MSENQAADHDATDMVHEIVQQCIELRTTREEHQVSRKSDFHECEFRPGSDEQGRWIMQCACGHRYRDTCTFELHGMRCVLYQCTDCGWYSHSADPGWSKRAGQVHSEFLEKGHRVELITSPHRTPNHADKQTPDA